MSVKRIVIVVAVVAFVVIYAVADVNSEHWMLQCPLYHLTGWQCPLCGAQRGIHAALHGHLAEAWSYNPGLWLMAPYWALWAASALSRRVAAWPLVRWCCQDKVFFSAVGVLLLWGVFRNFI